MTNQPKEEQLILSGIAMAVANSCQVLQNHWGFSYEDREKFKDLVTESITKAAIEHMEQSGNGQEPTA